MVHFSQYKKNNVAKGIEHNLENFGLKASSDWWSRNILSTHLTSFNPYITICQSPKSSLHISLPLYFTIPISPNLSLHIWRYLEKKKKLVGRSQHHTSWVYSTSLIWFYFVFPTVAKPILGVNVISVWMLGVPPNLYDYYSINLVSFKVFNVHDIYLF